MSEPAQRQAIACALCRIWIDPFDAVMNRREQWICRGCEAAARRYHQGVANHAHAQHQRDVKTALTIGLPVVGAVGVAMFVVILVALLLFLAITAVAIYLVVLLVIAAGSGGPAIN